MEKVLFREEQKFGQWWVWVIILCSFVAVIIQFSYGIYSQIMLGKPWGDKPTSDGVLIGTAVFVFVLMLLIILLFLRMKLITEVRAEGVWFRFPPLIRKWRYVKKEEIERFEIRTYRAIIEYGGYGIRYGRQRYGRAYNVSGNLGLQLYLHSGKKILIGTHKKQALEYAMNKMSGM
jgi:hypothetical protein